MSSEGAAWARQLAATLGLVPDALPSGDAELNLTGDDAVVAADTSALTGGEGDTARHTPGSLTSDVATDPTAQPVLPLAADPAQSDRADSAGAVVNAGAGADRARRALVRRGLARSGHRLAAGNPSNRFGAYAGRGPDATFADFALGDAILDAADASADDERDAQRPLRTGAYGAHAMPIVNASAFGAGGGSGGGSGSCAGACNAVDAGSNPAAEPARASTVPITPAQGVPEPSTYALLLVGLAIGVGRVGLRRRQRRRA